MVSVCKAIGDELQAIENLDCTEQERERLREEILQGPCKTFVDEKGTTHVRFAPQDFEGDMTLQQYYSACPMSFVDPMDTSSNPRELCPGGALREVELTAGSLTEYARLVTKWWFETGVERQVQAFRDGIDEVFPVSSLQTFTAQELQRMFCGDLQIQWVSGLNTAAFNEEQIKKLETTALL